MMDVEKRSDVQDSNDTDFKAFLPYRTFGFKAQNEPSLAKRHDSSPN
jgi:hypothetical protein